MITTERLLLPKTVFLISSLCLLKRKLDNNLLELDIPMSSGVDPLLMSALETSSTVAAEPVTETTTSTQL